MSADKPVPDVSIIVPLYNAEAHLQKCVESIRAQTFSNFEIILVNDGSTDGSARICGEYTALDPRISVIHKENGGIASALNAGLCAVRGRAISFIDSDDYIESGFVEKMYAALISRAAFCICGHHLVTKDGGRFGTSIPRNECVSAAALLDNYSSTRFRFDTYWPKMFLTDFVRSRSLSFFVDNTKSSNDTRFMFSCLFAARDSGLSVVYLDEALYNYYIHENSITHSDWSAEKTRLFFQSECSTFEWAAEHTAYRSIVTMCLRLLVEYSRFAGHHAVIKPELLRFLASAARKSKNPLVAGILVAARVLPHRLLAALETIYHRGKSSVELNDIGQTTRISP